MQVKRILVGIVGTNCYIVYDKDTKEAVVIDPGAEEERIISFIEEEGLKPEAILLTHGHFDHILAVPELREKYKIPLYAAKEEREMLGDGELNLSGRDPEDSVEIKEFIPLHDGEELEFLGRKWKVITSPGHTKGSVCYFLAGEIPYLFSGDTLFLESYGRTDLFSGSEKDIIKSIREKLFLLPDDTLVFRGMRKAQQYGMKRAIIRLISLSKFYQGCKKSN